MRGPMRLADVPAGAAAYKLIYPNEIISPNILVWTEESWTPVSACLPPDPSFDLLLVTECDGSSQAPDRQQGSYTEGEWYGCEGQLIKPPCRVTDYRSMPPLPEDHA